MFWQSLILQSKSRSKKSYIPSKDKIEWYIRVKLKEPKVCIQILQAYFSLIACIHIYQSREPMIFQYLLFAQGGSWKDTVDSVCWVKVVFSLIFHLDPKKCCWLNEDI